jgi:hypothetical protein
METPLTPLDFARRTRRLHGSRTAVVDGDLRFTYEQFFGRCDRWSAALAAFGIAPGVGGDPCARPSAATIGLAMQDVVDGTPVRYHKHSWMRICRVYAKVWPTNPRR